MNYRYAARKEVQAALAAIEGQLVGAEAIAKVIEHLKRAEDLLTPPSHKGRATHEFRRFGTFAGKKEVKKP